MPGPLSEIARGYSWVSPYWGYNTPKIVFDGTDYYTVGLWGASPEASRGVLYKFDGAKWREGTTLPEIYQPPTLVLDRNKRLVVAYTRTGRPVRLMRAREAGLADDFQDLPSPPDMSNAYYIGIAIRDEILYVAYLVQPSYDVCLAVLDLARLEWSPSIVLQKGQVEQKPKTAWTYPILYPTREGLHIIASNSPDGGDGNTYNEIWYSLYPRGESTPVRREKVAECAVGHLAYAMDMVVDAERAVHVVFMWNQRKYGEPLPEGSPQEGTYHAWRNPESGRWESPSRLGPVSICGFHEEPAGLTVVASEPGSIGRYRWSAEHVWKSLPRLLEPGCVKGGPSFMDVISRSSGSVMQGESALVFDAAVPVSEYESPGRALFALLPGNGSE